MTKSYAKDIQLLLAILRNQDNIMKAIERFGCNQNNLEKDAMALIYVLFIWHKSVNLQSCLQKKVSLL